MSVLSFLTCPFPLCLYVCVQQPNYLTLQLPLYVQYCIRIHTYICSLRSIIIFEPLLVVAQTSAQIASSPQNVAHMHSQIFTQLCMYICIDLHEMEKEAHFCFCTYSFCLNGLNIACSMVGHTDRHIHIQKERKKLFREMKCRSVKRFQE